MVDQQHSTIQKDHHSARVSKDGMENVQPQPSHNEQGTPIPDGDTSIPKKAGPEKAKVFCNCCNWSSQTCGFFWAIFNIVQVAICYTVLVFEILFSEGINTTIEGFQKNLLKFNNDKNFTECLEHLKVSGTPNSTAKLSIQIIMLLIYTIGSVSFCFAVFFQCLNVQRRSLCLLIYLATILCLPVAYYVPLIIVFTGCVYAGLGLIILWFWWYITVIVTTGLAINISFVFRDWILRNPASIPPPSQQQSIQMGGEGESSNETGKTTSEDRSVTDDSNKNKTDAKIKTSRNKNKTNAKNKTDVKNEKDDENRTDSEV